MMNLHPGRILRTNYNTGPYTVTDVSGPCTCTEYVRSLDGDTTPSEPHYHLTCKGMVAHHKGHTYWLNGFKEDGTSVWGKDRLIFDNIQLGLF